MKKMNIEEIGMHLMIGLMIQEYGEDQVMIFAYLKEGIVPVEFLIDNDESRTIVEELKKEYGDRIIVHRHKLSYIRDSLRKNYKV
ncbi:hypothetical protein BKP56_09375 [Marinilactibacillus sp. 15R]|uniref:hypothetical protein n=1 Tax=Marinilactibacillus sp. 15R TaxID=1911586 RepID=UPI00090BE0B1|nr:hypothetical protein [Marinilactibacillus sp. 15R]API89452.1 hypothetical protein BKP56_09375 [Marinilactibacillus sp. 15R]